MQKTKPSANKLNMDFLNAMDNQITPAAATAAETSAPVEEKKNPVTEIKVTDYTDSENRYVKNSQIVIRATEEQRDEMKTYFMSHGITLSQGIKIAVKYLQEQEKKGAVHFSGIGLY